MEASLKQNVSVSPIVLNFSSVSLTSLWQKSGTGLTVALDRQLAIDTTGYISYTMGVSPNIKFGISKRKEDYTLSVEMQSEPSDASVAVSLEKNLSKHSSVKVSGKSAFMGIASSNTSNPKGGEISIATSRQISRNSKLGMSVDIRDYGISLSLR